MAVKQYLRVKPYIIIFSWTSLGVFISINIQLLTSFQLSLFLSTLQLLQHKASCPVTSITTHMLFTTGVCSFLCWLLLFSLTPKSQLGLRKSLGSRSAEPGGAGHKKCALFFHLFFCCPSGIIIKLILFSPHPNQLRPSQQHLQLSLKPP